MNRPNDGKVERRLTGAQATLVRDNLGLVGVHLRKRVVGHGPPLPRDQWDELFQEGCIGLIEAALRFRAERGIAFAAFALPRIRTAINRAIARMVVPARRPRERCPDRRDPEQAPAGFLGGVGERAGPGSRLAQRKPAMLPRVESENSNAMPWAIDFERQVPALVAGATDSHLPPAQTSPDTLGDRLRARFMAAVRGAAAALVADDRGTKRRDRATVVNTLVEERILVTREDERCPLREVARRLACPYTRVAVLDRRLRSLIIERLGADAAYLLLRRFLRREGVDTNTVMDTDFETELMAEQCVWFLRAFHSADEHAQGAILRELCRFSGEKGPKWVLAGFSGLLPAPRDELLCIASRSSAPRSVSRGPKAASKRCGAWRGQGRRGRAVPRDGSQFAYFLGEKA